MSVRRQTANRLTLFRTCGTCGKQIVTTADTPWVRQVERARNRAYQQAHREELREKARLRRLAHPGQAAADSAYARRKRKLKAEEAQANAG